MRFPALVLPLLCAVPAFLFAEKTPFRVDRYGQNAAVDFPSKVLSDADLAADVKRQAGELAPFDTAGLDAYGGLAGSGKRFGLKATGFFRVDQAAGRQVLVTPEGNVFFHLGVCGLALSDVFTLVKGREDAYEWLPPRDGAFSTAWRPSPPGIFSFYVANWIRKYGRPFSLEDWSGQMVDRLRSWGFNSGGAFSEYTRTMRERRLPYVSWLPTGEEFGAKMLPDKLGASKVLDPFAPGAAAALDQAYRRKLSSEADDPLIIGYFNGNEQHFELLAKMVPGYRASVVPAKARLVVFLRERYGSIEKFDAAWQPATAFRTFEDLGEAALEVRTEPASEDMRAYCRLYLETYFSLVEQTFRKFDSHHLLIGNRLTPGTANNRDVVEISGAHVDVMSVNYYSYAIEKDFLAQVHRWSGGKPLILSEWYFSSIDTGLGAGKEVKNQDERAKAYRHYVEQAAALPFVVGSEWFIYLDQAITGRYFEGLHGEGNNTGLVSVTDRPYAPLVAATRQTGERIYDVMFGRVQPFLFQDPRFVGGRGAHRAVNIPRALPGLKMDGSTTNWPGRPAEPIEASRVAVGNANAALRGDFRLCWDEENLYFLIQVKDPTPGRNLQPSNSLWSGDAVELFLGSRRLGEGGSMVFGDTQILLGAGDSPRIFIDGREAEAARCRVVRVPDVSGDGYVLEAAIPWLVLKMDPKAGLEFLFDVAIDNSDDGKVRRQQLVWNGTAKNPGDRGAWGRARLTDN